MNYLRVKTVLEVIALAEVCYPTDSESQIVSVSVNYDSYLSNSPEEQALYQKVASLSSEQLAELQTLMLIGREASGETPEDWDTLYYEALSSEHANSVEYIASKYPLAQYLRDGLVKLGLQN